MLIRITNPEEIASLIDKESASSKDGRIKTSLLKKILFLLLMSLTSGKIFTKLFKFKLLIFFNNKFKSSLETGPTKLKLKNLHFFLFFK